MSYTSYINEQVKQGIVKPKAISTSVKMYLHSERSCYENDEMLLFKDNKFCMISALPHGKQDI